MTTAEASQATTEINARLERLASKRSEIARRIKEVGDMVFQAEGECAAECDAVHALVRLDRSGRVAALVAKGIADRKIDTGTMSYRFIEDMERHGHRIYPPPYKVEKPGWAIVSDL